MINEWLHKTDSEGLTRLDAIFFGGGQLLFWILFAAFWGFAT